MRMQVVAMVLLWSLARMVAPECQSCVPVKFTIPMVLGGLEGLSCTLETQGCAGLCDHKDPVYVSNSGGTPHEDKQKTCQVQDWWYENQSVYCVPPGDLGGTGGIEVKVSMPKVRTCGCSLCDTESTDCTPNTLPSQLECGSSRHLLHHHL